MYLKKSYHQLHIPFSLVHEIFLACRYYEYPSSWWSWSSTPTPPSSFSASWTHSTVTQYTTTTTSSWNKQLLIACYTLLVYMCIKYVYNKCMYNCIVAQGIRNRFYLQLTYEHTYWWWWNHTFNHACLLIPWALELNKFLFVQSNSDSQQKSKSLFLKERIFVARMHEIQILSCTFSNSQTISRSCFCVGTFSCRVSQIIHKWINLEIKCIKYRYIFIFALEKTWMVKLYKKSTGFDYFWYLDRK